MNLMNYIMENNINQETNVQVGMGVTVNYYSDRHAGTIIKVSPSGKTITIQQDNAVRADDNGMSDSQKYEYERNVEGRTWTARLNKKGKFYTKCKCYVGIGYRDEHYDYTF